MEEYMDILEYAQKFQQALDDVIAEAREARMLGKKKEARAKGDELHELVFEHTQLMRSYSISLEHQAREETDPEIRTGLLRLKRIAEESIHEMSEPINQLAINSALEED
jgi:hypothetical protein